MKMYEKIAVILQENSKADSKYNKLLKLKYQIQDDQLLYLVEEVMTAYKYYIEPRWTKTLTEESRLQGVPSNNREWRQYSIPRIEKLKEYVEIRLSERIPEWQVTALRHGWKPTLN